MRVLYVATVSMHINSFMIPHIKMLKENGYQVDIASHLIEDIDDELINLGCKIYNVKFSRNPLSLDNIKAYKKIKKIIEESKYDIVHTHTPIASAFVRIACKSNNKIKVIYTAHGFHFFKGAPLKNWIIYYPIEKYLSKYTDVLITINQEDYIRAKKHFKAKKIIYVPGIGFNKSKIQNQKVNKVEFRDQLGIPHNAFVILSVGELNKNKNHETIIKAISRMNYNNIYYIVCGAGSYREKLEQLANEVELNDKVKLLGYRDDVKEILEIADLFAFPSFREGLPVSVMEAMAAKLPIVCSDIRGNNDLIKHNENGYLVKPDDIEGFKGSLKTIYNNPEIKKKFIKKNSEVIELFSIESVLKHMLSIYNKEIM